MRGKDGKLQGSLMKLNHGEYLAFLSFCYVGLGIFPSAFCGFFMSGMQIPLQDESSPMQPRCGKKFLPVKSGFGQGNLNCWIKI